MFWKRKYTVRSRNNLITSLALFIANLSQIRIANFWLHNRLAQFTSQIACNTNCYILLKIVWDNGFVHIWFFLDMDEGNSNDGIGWRKYGMLKSKVNSYLKYSDKCLLAWCKIKNVIESDLGSEILFSIMVDPIGRFANKNVMSILICRSLCEH